MIALLVHAIEFQGQVPDFTAGLFLPGSEFHVYSRRLAGAVGRFHQVSAISVPISRRAIIQVISVVVQSWPDPETFVFHVSSGSSNEGLGR